MLLKTIIFWLQTYCSDTTRRLQRRIRYTYRAHQPFSEQHISLFQEVHTNKLPYQLLWIEPTGLYKVICGKLSVSCIGRTTRKLHKKGTCLECNFCEETPLKILVSCMHKVHQSNTMEQRQPQNLRSYPHIERNPASTKEGKHKKVAGCNSNTFLFLHVYSSYPHKHRNQQYSLSSWKWNRNPEISNAR